MLVCYPYHQNNHIWSQDLSYLETLSFYICHLSTPASFWHELNTCFTSNSNLHAAVPLSTLLLLLFLCRFIKLNPYTVQFPISFYLLCLPFITCLRSCLSLSYGVQVSFLSQASKPCTFISMIKHYMIIWSSLNNRPIDFFKALSSKP